MQNTIFKPSSTYRIQFHKEFTFKHLDQLIPYFIALGVTTIYASPIFAAIPGSTHGYDGVNPHQINPEIGTEAELLKLSRKLKKAGISWLQDIVPNHISFHRSNSWLMDVLEKWKESAYFNFFDLDFPTALTDKRLMVPFLAEDLDKAIENGAIKVVLADKKLHLSYGEDSWPMNSTSYQLVLPKINDLDAFQKFIATKHGQAALTRQLQQVNTDKLRLTKIANAQYYRLCHWQETEHQINYRRFFTVNSLICLNIQTPQVFQAYHQYIFKLIKLGVFQGLRIDHVDGLSDPSKYLKELREAVGSDIYIVVEKILGDEEQMPNNWPVQGNTGYDFLAMVNNLFTNRSAEKSFTDLYQEVIDKPLHVDEQIIAKKKAILFGFMQGELDHLVQLFLTLELEKSISKVKFSKAAWKEAIADFLIHCPVYRFYGNDLPFSAGENQKIKTLIESIPKTKRNSASLGALSHLLLAKKNPKVLAFYQRCMQFSGPLMAKGVEDTLMYTYNRFVGHTEVGDTPAAFGLSADQFHQLMAQRLQRLPYSMNGTATHDTKRGEDVRARLNVLTDIPLKWIKLVRQLKKQTVDGKGQDFGLHQNDMYLIFQTLLGTMPFETENDQGLDDRLMQYVEKALRETKKRSNWASPNQEYESRAKNFILSLLHPHHKSYTLLAGFIDEIADFSIINALSQLLLKFTCPGIPDLYQGTELWDLTLVDPDNRRPVDFSLRQQWLGQLSAEVDVEQLWTERKSGKIKLWLTHTLLQFRTRYLEVFEQGNYIPVAVQGKYSKHVLAFLRQHENQWLLVTVPLGLAGILPEEMEDVRNFDWEDTRLVLPAQAPMRWTNALTGEQGKTDVIHDGVMVKDIFNKLPIGLLILKPSEHKRGSGILMPIFSLPSNFGIGDMGKESYKFVDFLAATGQKYWQLLPLNPVLSEHFNSPYASDSAMAGSKLFISPEFLLTEGLLSKNDLKPGQAFHTLEVNYQHVRNLKDKLLHKAYLNFVAIADHRLKAEFLAFCENEAFWLADYSLFAALRRHHQDLPWNKWPKKYKMREQKALQIFSAKYISEIEEIKWLQFIFHDQWTQLKQYANSKGIQLIGDLPFYVAYNSADVWSNPQAFKLDNKLNMQVVAGVPPDSLNPDGQLWGMPIFNWEHLKRNKFGWWLDRIKKNIELFDIVRIDHFRAIHSYWEVDVQETTAKNGHWTAGPAETFMCAIAKKFKELPFVVEDLGEEMEEPSLLREEFNLAGMKVLQFAFGSDMPDSTYLPHHYASENYLAYIGTHDNNTAKGWFTDDLNTEEKKRLTLYVGAPLAARNIAKVMMKMVLASTARIAVLQMQDLLALDGKARMNVPGTTEGNWIWRMKKNAIHAKLKDWLRQQTLVYGRA